MQQTLKFLNLKQRGYKAKTFFLRKNREMKESWRKKEF